MDTEFQSRKMKTFWRCGSEGSKTMLIYLMPQNCTLKMVKMVLILLQKKEKNLNYSDNQRSPEYLRLDSFIHSTHIN